MDKVVVAAVHSIEWCVCRYISLNDVVKRMQRSKEEGDRHQFKRVASERGKNLFFNFCVEFSNYVFGELWTLFRLTYSMKYVVELKCWSDWFYLDFKYVLHSSRLRVGQTNERIERRSAFSKNFVKNWKSFFVFHIKFCATIVSTAVCS